MVQGSPDMFARDFIALPGVEIRHSSSQPTWGQNHPRKCHFRQVEYEEAAMDCQNYVCAGIEMHKKRRVWGRFSSARAFLNEVWVLSLILILCAPLSAQKYLGGIAGEVTDSSGAKIVGAKLTATDVSNHFSTSVVTTNAGLYTFASMNPGVYVLTVSATGFGTTSRSEVLVTAGQTAQQDFALSVGDTSQTVNVMAESTNPLWDPNSPNVAETLNSKEVSDAPNPGRNPEFLTLLSPGVTTTTYSANQAGIHVTPEDTPTGVYANGQTGGSYYRATLNGMPNDNPERFDGNGSYSGFYPSQEAVQEVKTITLPVADAQYGHGNGMVTNVVVKGGSNAFHGAAYYVFQNTYLNANQYQRVPQQDTITPRPDDQWNQAGGVLSGPFSIPKVYNGYGKTYFMVAFEHFQNRTPTTPDSGLVPTAAERTGDFSDLCHVFNGSGVCTNGIQIYDPLTKDSSNNRTPFPYNKIPAARISSVGSAYMTFLPLPNTSQGASVNYVSNINARQWDPTLIFRMDHNFGEKDKLSGIYFRATYSLSRVDPLLPKGYTTSSSAYRYTQGGNVDHVHIFSNTLILDTRFGVIQRPLQLFYPGDSDSAQLGMSSPVPYQSFPGFSNSDSYIALGSSPGQKTTSTLGDLSITLTKILGRHSIRTGFIGDLLRYNGNTSDSGYKSFSFNRQFTQKNSVNIGVGSDANSGNPIASMLLGFPSSGSYAVNAQYAFQQKYVALFVQDDWRITSKLTFNLGARWDYESPFTERHNMLNSSFCTSCTNPLQASVPSLTLNGGLEFVSSSSRLPYPKDLNNFQPRLGIAYQATSRTTLRGGFGIIYFNTFHTPIAQGYSVTTTYTSTVDGSIPVGSLYNPYPVVNLPAGSSDGLLTYAGQSIGFYDPSHIQPKATQWTASIQQRLPADMVLQIAYVGNHPANMPVSYNINYLPQMYYDQGASGVSYLNATVPNPMVGLLPNTALNAGTVQRNKLLLPYPEFGSITKSYSSIGSAFYNGLQVSLSKPLRHGISFHTNVTWSKTSSKTGFRNPYDLQLARDWDSSPTLASNSIASYVWPRFSHLTRTARFFLGGWQTNVIVRLQNGNLVPNPSGVTILRDPTITSVRTYQHAFNTCYLDTAGVKHNCTIDSDPAWQIRLPYTSQMNSNYMHLRYGANGRLDASMFKKFPIHESMTFEIRGEFFNLANTPNFGAPNTSIGSTTFGAVTLTQVNDPRIGQLTARINF